VTFRRAAEHRKMEFVPGYRRSVKLFTSVDTTAFASILVTLVLIIFVVASMSSNRHRALSVDIPEVSHPASMRGALRDDAMKVSILRDGQVYFCNDRVWSDDLGRRIQDRLKDRGVERKVYITADARAQYGWVKAVLDGVRSAGIVRVAFLADQRRVPSFTR
jgi:biopolymer transport protein TolR